MSQGISKIDIFYRSMYIYIQMTMLLHQPVFFATKHLGLRSIPHVHAASPIMCVGSAPVQLLLHHETRHLSSKSTMTQPSKPLFLEEQHAVAREKTTWSFLFRLIVFALQKSESLSRQSKCLSFVIFDTMALLFPLAPLNNVGSKALRTCA